MLKLTYIISERKLIVNTGAQSYTMIATSGRGQYMNDSNAVNRQNEGPIPPGEYIVNSNEIDNPNRLKDMLRQIKSGDWGDWLVPLRPKMNTNTFGRRGFYLHGGSFEGSAGCIDIGGGVWGNDETNRLLNDIKNGGIIDLTVRK